jgi:hypothetical protein
MTLCALLHKFRPDLIRYSDLSPSDSVANLSTAMKAAGTYFGLEPYLQPTDIAKLDEKSMLVFVSEFYSGITEQLKLELAARRLAQVIAFTMTNDQLKSQYDAEAQKLNARLDTATTQLEELKSSQSDTMAQAKHQLAKFTTYRSTEKRSMLSEHIKLEALFTNLATRLADNNRPSYVPRNPDLHLDRRATRLRTLQLLEQEVCQ